MLEALTYGLMLKPQLLTVSLKVMQILGEVLAMTEADDLDAGRNAIPALYNSLPGSRSTHTGFPSKTGVRDMQSPSELPHVVQVRYIDVSMYRSIDPVLFFCRKDLNMIAIDVDELTTHKAAVLVCSKRIPRNVGTAVSYALDFIFLTWMVLVLCIVVMTNVQSAVPAMRFLPSRPQLRVSAIRLMHIVMVTKPEAFMETDVLKDARTRCISLFFKSLTSRADQVLYRAVFYSMVVNSCVPLREAGSRYLCSLIKTDARLDRQDRAGVFTSLIFVLHPIQQQAGGGRSPGGAGASHLHEPAVQGQVRHAEGPAAVVPPPGAQEPHAHTEAQPAAAAGIEPAAVPAVELVQRHPGGQVVRVLAAVDGAAEAAVAAGPQGLLCGPLCGCAFSCVGFIERA